MKRLIASLIICASVLLGAAPGFCEDGPVTTLWEDPETGQLFTKPADGRVPVDPVKDLKMPEAALSGLYEDDESGALYTKPAQGRSAVAVASGGPATAAPAATAAAVDEETLAKKVLAGLPSWMNKFSVKGDLRLRYDMQDTEGKEEQHRGRYRARVFLDFKVNDMFSTHFLVASGGDDPKSANQTFTGSFEAPDFRLRKAYADFRPWSWLLVRGGQMENVLYRPSDGIWDKDVNPTGGGVSVDYKTGGLIDPQLNAALYVIDDVKESQNDPFMYVVQPGFKLNLTKDMHFRAAAAYYGYESLQGSVLDHAAGSNTVDGMDALVFDYDGVVISSDFGIKKPVSFINYLGVFGEYAYNFDPDRLNEGYIVGIELGDEKIKKQGQWQVMGSWRTIEKDAILDILPDSDAFSGKTNIRGYELAAKYGLFDHVELGVDWYHLGEITTDVDEDRLQLDLVFSF